ncbi:family 1 glycosylhydrolase [Streptomyces fradiae]|uniref:family 1 glycosylhydrolase n=1 Tax=Streptomyces fradiae TaxID=1906 RepID=UPI00369C2867
MRRPAAVLGSDSGEVACGHYHRRPEYVTLLRGPDVDSYRLLREPGTCAALGQRPANRAGLDFHARLVDGPHDARIEPAVTLHHRDLPQAGEERGGRRDREVARDAAEGADKVGPCVCTKSVSAYREGGSGPPFCWV